MLKIQSFWFLSALVFAVVANMKVVHSPLRTEMKADFNAFKEVFRRELKDNLKKFKEDMN